MLSIEQRIAHDIAAKTEQVQAAIGLLDGGATGPFIARYRKEVTGGLDDPAAFAGRTPALPA